MYSIYCGQIPIYIPGESDFMVWDAKLTLGMNVSGSLSFNMLKSHPNFNILAIMDKEISVRQDSTIVFRGRILKMETTFENIVNVTCEGELSYLLDSIQPSRVYDGLTIAEFLYKMLEGENGHNEQMSDDTSIDKKFYLKDYDGSTKAAEGIDNIYYVAKYDVNNDGEVNAFDVSAAEEAEDEDLANEIRDYINGVTAPKAFKRTVDMQNTFDIISDKILTPYGGMLSIVHNSDTGVDKKYLKYQKTYKYTGATITVGENLLDYSKSSDASDIVTQLIPLGSDISETDSLSSELLRGKTWLALGDELTAGITSGEFDGSNFVLGSVLHTSDQFSYSNENRFTSDNRSYVNLLCEASHMGAVSMAVEGSEIYKTNGRLRGTSQTVYIPAASVTQMLLKEYGPASIEQITKKDKIKDDTVSPPKDYSVKYKTGTKAVMNSDIYPNKFTDYDFVTVFIGLNDWLMSNSILGTFEDAKRYAADSIVDNYTMSHPYPMTLNSVGPNVIVNSTGNEFTQVAILDYFRKGVVYNDEDGEDHSKPYDEDKKPVKFKMTIYAQLFFLCRYLKACFPKSHIIFFTPFGARNYTENRYPTDVSGYINEYTKDHTKSHPGVTPEKVNVGTGYQNKLGMFSLANIYYNHTEEDTLKEQTVKQGETDNRDTEWNSSGNKVYVNGTYEKKTRTKKSIKDEALTGIPWNNGENPRMFSVATPPSSSGGDSSSQPKRYTTNIVSYDSYDEDDENKTKYSIIRDPFGELEGMSFSIEDVRSAINEVCEEFEITVVDTESEADISVNNYSKITKDTVNAVATVEYKVHDNLGSSGTAKGIWGESFKDGMHLNDLGQKKMAKVVRDAFISALGETLNEKEKLEKEAEDEKDINKDKDVDAETADDTSGTSDYLTIRTSKASYMKCPAGNNTYYIYGKQLGDDGTGIILKLKGMLTVDPTNNTETFKPMSTEFSGVTRTMQWDWIKDPDKLMKKGVQYLFAQHQKSIDSITCKAIDLSIINGDYKQFKIGDKVLLYSPAHGIYNEMYILTDMDIDMQRPENTTYTFGNNSSTSLSTIGIGKNNTSATNISLSSIEPWEGIING